MGDSSEKFGDTGIIELIGKILVIAIVILLFVVVLIFCLRLYAKYILHRRSGNPSSITGRRRPLDLAAGQSEIAVSRLGLEHSVLETLPIIIFDPKDFKEGLECSVCLSEISGGEKTRLLPKCNHGFHLDCIDMWFESHSTCPLCRDPVTIQNSGDQLPLEVVIIQAPTVENSPNFPTNVLIYGDETRVNTSSPCVEENNHHHLYTSNAIVEPLSSSSSSSSSSSMGSTSGTLDGISTVDIPRGINEDDERKSPLPTRLRSLKRLLSYNNNNNRRVNPSSSRNLDLEQGGGTG